MFRFWKNLFRWSGTLVPSCLISILQSTALVISQFGVLMFFGVSSCKYWEWKNISLHSLLQWSSKSALYWHIPAYCLPLYLLIRILGSSCAVSLWCLLNVSICTPISCFFMHPHLLLSIGHHFVPNHSYLQCFSGEEMGMTVYVFVLFSTSVIIAFGTGWLFIYCVHHWFLRSYHFEKNIVYTWYFLH